MECVACHNSAVDLLQLAESLEVVTPPDPCPAHVVSADPRRMAAHTNYRSITACNAYPAQLHRMSIGATAILTKPSNLSRRRSGRSRD
jgi:hypothetical protein